MAARKDEHFSINLIKITMPLIKKNFCLNVFDKAFRSLEKEEERIAKENPGLSPGEVYRRACESICE